MKCSQRYTVYGENGASNIYQSLQSDILLVDDNAVDAQIFQSALRQGSSRAQVYWVASGEEALDFLRQRRRFENVGPVKIVVLDLHLPGHDGFEILRQIKSDPSLSRIPVIMFTSGTAQNEIDLAYSLGANAYFKKPATLETYVELLLVLVQHWLDLAQLPAPARPIDVPDEHGATKPMKRGREDEL